MTKINPFMQFLFLLGNPGETILSPRPEFPRAPQATGIVKNQLAHSTSAAPAIRVT